ncbi:hypothetical protein HPB47_012224 [Ixodes persulcatus]|uniref:Uncharacterized protein n=1 Tax=Ixodes persulcatus TaxID=34615 RepID=A0AC60NU85_IXOPE|nr:hypothetical protein HPB47_012224 [Ixodes persulcatus]
MRGLGGLHFDSSPPDGSQPVFSERAELAKLERKKILRNLRTAASLFNRHKRMIPPMSAEPVIWECPEHAAARFDTLADISAADQPNTFEDWVIPQDKPPPTVRRLWNQFCSFFYVDGGPARFLHRWPSVTANSRLERFATFRRAAL